MTDGIIQKVIEKWFMSNLLPNGVLTHELTYTDILILQGQLIEEIKNEFPKNFHKNSPEINAIWLAWIRRKLIGDNQE